MSLHRVDPRFVLPHRVGRAIVLGLEQWRMGLTSAGIEVSDGGGDARGIDLVVAPASRAAEAARIGARSVIVEGSRERTLRAGDAYATRRLLVRPTHERPSLALPLDQPRAASYALAQWSVLDRRWKRARMEAARVLVARGLFPPWASPLVTVGSRAPGAPGMLVAARELGVHADAAWFLTLGQGDALSRNAFQIFGDGGSEPEWILKFARVPDYVQRFDDDERGLRLAHTAGGLVAARAPRLLGRFELDGIHASLESAVVGRRLRDLLGLPGRRAEKLALIDEVAAWIIELGRRTQASPDALEAERARLRDVVARWSSLGAPGSLVDALPPLPAVLQHNDLGAWNVVADRRGGFAVVDWENVREAALPLWDLLYFLCDALVVLDGTVATGQRPQGMTRLFSGGSPSSGLLFEWVRRGSEAARVPPDAVGAVATLCWLSHSLSADLHNRDIAAFTPHDPPRVHGFEGLAPAWMAHPALGPQWSLWRG